MIMHNGEFKMSEWRILIVFLLINTDWSSERALKVNKRILKELVEELLNTEKEYTKLNISHTSS